MDTTVGRRWLHSVSVVAVNINNVERHLSLLSFFPWSYLFALFLSPFPLPPPQLVGSGLLNDCGKPLRPPPTASSVFSLHPTSCTASSSWYLSNVHHHNDGGLPTTPNRLGRYGDTDAGEPCGTDVNPADGNGCKDGPATVKVCGQNGMLFDAIYPTVG